MNSRSKKAEKRLEEELKDYLRSNGKMIPVTQAQADAFHKKIKSQKVELPALLSDPIAMLKRGYIKPSPPTQPSNEKDNNTLKMAARKLEKLPPEVLQKMEKDRRNAQKEK